MSKKNFDINQALDNCSPEQADRMAELMDEMTIDKKTIKNIERIFFEKMKSDKQNNRVENKKKSNSYTLKKWSAIAACITFLIVLSVTVFPSLMQRGVNNPPLERTDDSKTPTEVKYYSMELSYMPYFNSQELVDYNDAIFIGKVTKISFQVLDMTTGLPPTKKTEDRDKTLHTIYDIDIEVSYKGDSSIKQIRQFGGIKDHYIEEQISVLKNANAWESGILVFEYTENIEIGKSYLFAVSQFETCLPTFGNPPQSVYDMHNPFEEHPHGLTAKSIISIFGQDKWDSYWKQWKIDNPDWESNITKLDITIINEIFNESNYDVEDVKKDDFMSDKQDIYENLTLIKTYDDCAEYKSTPVFHDESTVVDVKLMLGEPDYMTDNILYYKLGDIMLLFNNKKLTGIALLHGIKANTDTLFERNIEYLSVLNLKKAQEEVEKKITEDNIFKEKRDAILTTS